LNKPGFGIHLPASALDVRIRFTHDNQVNNLYFQLAR